MNVTFVADITDYRRDHAADGADVEYVSLRGTATVDLPFVPFVDMHLGESQLLTVCQVHWLGDGFLADLQMINCLDTDRLCWHRQYGGDPNYRQWENVQAAAKSIEERTPTLTWIWEDKNNGRQQ